MGLGLIVCHGTATRATVCNLYTRANRARVARKRPRHPHESHWDLRGTINGELGWRERDRATLTNHSRDLGAFIRSRKTSSFSELAVSFGPCFEHTVLLFHGLELGE